MNWAIAAIVLNSISATTVLWTSLCAINRMSRSTYCVIRAAYILISVGAAAVLMAPGYLGRAPTQAELLMICGMALLTLADRRKSFSRRLLHHTS